MCCNFLGIQHGKWHSRIVMPQLEPSPIDAASEIVQSAEETSRRRFWLIASKIEADPGLLELGLANIERWLARGHSSVTRLNGWRRIIRGAQVAPKDFNALLCLLRDDSAEALQWKAFHPFPGVLSEDELEMIAWTSSH